MSALSIQPTYPIFTDIDGQPLEDGYVWIGTANLDPQTNPINVYWDAALTQLAGQPIRTQGGYPVNSGTPARLYVNSDYSIRVQNSKGSLVYSAPEATERYSEVVVNITAADVSFTQAGATAPADTRNVQEKLEEYVTPPDFGAVGDGAVNDTTAFTNLESVYTGGFIDLVGKTYLVNAYPSGNYYFNGFFKIGADTFNASSAQSVISDVTDTGGIEPAYTGGVNNTPTISGRNNDNTRAIIASQNCRSQFARSINVASIYSWAYGNVSGNYSARQSVAACPQSVNTASEECFIQGFRGFHAGSIFSEMVASTGVTLGSRFGFNSATYSGIYSSNTVRAGFGRRARLTPVIVSGVVTSITIDAAGDGYTTNDQITVIDRQAFGSGATATISSVDINGAITGISISNGGANYGPQTVAYVICEGEQIAVIASELSNIGQGNNLAAIATRSVNGRGNESLIAASSGGSSTAATFSRQAVISSSDASAEGNGAVVLSGVICEAVADGAVVFGRRTINNQTRSIAFGDAVSGSASTANRKFHLFATGNMSIAGTLTQSAIFTDYAEYFENLNNGEIALGTLVALEGRKVKPTQQGDIILGVVSATASIAAGDSPFTWAQRYLTGEFGELLYHEILDPDWPAMVKDPSWKPTDDHTEADRPLIPNPNPQPMISVPIENPDYKPELENVPRSERPDEWTCVGLLGQVHVRVASDVQVGDFVAAGDGGIGVKSDTATNMRCMEIRKPFDAAKGYAVAFCLLK